VNDDSRARAAYFAYLGRVEGDQWCLPWAELSPTTQTRFRRVAAALAIPTDEATVERLAKAAYLEYWHAPEMGKVREWDDDDNHHWQRVIRAVLAALTESPPDVPEKDGDAGDDRPGNQPDKDSATRDRPNARKIPQKHIRTDARRTLRRARIGKDERR
jgi:hypothetical protein